MLNQLNEISNSSQVDLGRYKFVLFERAVHDSFKLRTFAQDFEDRLEAGEEISDYEKALHYNEVNATAVNDSIKAWANSLPLLSRWWMKKKYARRRLVRIFGQLKLFELAELVAQLEELPGSNGKPEVDEKKKIKNQLKRD